MPFLFLLVSKADGLFAQTGPTCTSKEYIYLNEPNNSSVLKFEVGSSVALTEVLGANGGTLGTHHWYPGTTTSQLGSPHGLATDLNGKLYIGNNGNNGPIRRLTCDGVIEPIGPATFTTAEIYTQNIFSIGNTIYHNSNLGPTAYNSCTGAKIGKMCLNGASNNNQWGLSYNPKTEMVYATDRSNNNVWAFTRGQLEAGVAGNPGPCVNPITNVPSRPRNGEVFGIAGDNAGNFYVVRSGSTIFKYNSAGVLIAEVDIQAHALSPAGIVWSENTNRLYVSNLDGSPNTDCISVIDAATMTYLGTGVANPANGANGSKAIAILKEACPTNLPATFTRNVCGAVGKKFYLNQEAFAGCDGIVCGSSWTPTSMAGMVFDTCDNSVTITGEGCGVFTLNIGAVSSTGCPAQTSTFTICNTFPPDITVTTQANCTPNGKYTLTGTVTVSGPGTPISGTLTVRVPGGGSQTFNAPFSGTINYSIPNITTTGGTRSVYAEFSDGNCQKEQVYTEPVNCPICTSPLATNITLSKTAPTCTGSTSNNNGKITLTSASNTDKCGISTIGATTYDGPAYASATAYAANKDVKTAIPNTGGTYILRLYNGSDLCYKDTTITVAAVSCCTKPVVTVSPKNQKICEGGTPSAFVANSTTSGLTYQWYGPLADTTGTLGTGIATQTNASYTPTTTAAGKYYYAVVGTAVATCSDTAFVVFEISAKPTLSVTSTNCNVNGLTFDVATSTNGTLSADKGTVSGINITGVPAGQTVTITASLNGCTTTATATKTCAIPCTVPNCSTQVTVQKN